MYTWKEDLGNFFIQREKKAEVTWGKSRLQQQEYLESRREVNNFFLTIVIPAFDELKSELEKYNSRVNMVRNLAFEASPATVSLVVEYDNQDSVGFKYTEQFSYKILSPDETAVWIDIRYMENSIIREEVCNLQIRSTAEDDVYSISKQDIIDNFMYCYEKYI